MSAKEMIALLIQIISSWQVIVVTVVFILYIFLVSYVARLYHRPRSIPVFPARVKGKKKKAAPAASESDEDESAENTDDELGLEERE
jgi:heme/copper-type cytochrome/quinol oxidase subunit 2